MPELPDVEIFRRYAQATSLRRRIDDVFLRENVVDGVHPQSIRDGLRGAQLTKTRRHGKHLFLGASTGDWLRLHFGMTGHLEAFSTGGMPEHTELRLDFADGSHLAFVDPRKLGEISLVDDPESFATERGLGPDPVADDLSAPEFRKRFEDRRGTLKGTLMNQEVLAGLGNVYVDEILFQAGIHPESETAAAADTLDRLYDVMHRVIACAMDRGAESLPDTWLLPHREAGSACARCEGEIERIEVVGRATYLCPRHQRRLE